MGRRVMSYPCVFVSPSGAIRYEVQHTPPAERVEMMLPAPTRGLLLGAKLEPLSLAAEKVIYERGEVVIPFSGAIVWDALRRLEDGSERRAVAALRRLSLDPSGELRVYLFVYAKDNAVVEQVGRASQSLLWNAAHESRVHTLSHRERRRQARHGRPGRRGARRVAPTCLRSEVSFWRMVGLADGVLPADFGQALEREWAFARRWREEQAPRAEPVGASA